MMGKTTRWLRALLGAQKSSELPASSRSDSRLAKNKNKWGLVRSLDGNIRNNVGTMRSFPEASSLYVETGDANKHAIAVAAATAAVAEAALAAAHAAAEVVRLTSGDSRATFFSSGGDRRRELAAVKIQSAFRAYLARRALKALKGLVKLQALVRGHIVRKQSTHMLQRMQAMARIQVRASAHRAYMSVSPQSSTKSSNSQHGFASLKTYGTNIDGSALKSGPKSSIEDNVYAEKTNAGSNWLDQWMEQNSSSRHSNSLPKNWHADDEKSDKILEVDTWKPRTKLEQSEKTFQHHVSSWNHNEHIFMPFETLSRLSTKSQRPNPHPSPQESLNLRSPKFNKQVDQAAVWTAENSPGVCSASSRPGSSSSRRGPFTPSRTNGCAKNLFTNYTGHSNYMANTESSQAKVRSQSAPRQRMLFEKPGSAKRFVRGYWDEQTSSERGWPLHGNFRTRDYPGYSSTYN